MERTESNVGHRPRKYVMKKPKNGHIYGEVGQHFFLRGKHQGLIFFIRNNKQCVRTQGDMTTERWWKDERFANSRGASREFGAACAYSGAIRKGLGKAAKEVGGTKVLHNKVVKRVLHSFKGLPGKRGERVLNGGHVAARLVRLPWNKDGRTNLMPYGFSKAVVEPMIWKPKVEFEFVPGFRVPEWASEVRVVFNVVAIGDMVKRKNGKKYSVTKQHRALHGVGRSVGAEWVGISSSSGLSTSSGLGQGPKSWDSAPFDGLRTSALIQLWGGAEGIAEGNGNAAESLHSWGSAALTQLSRDAPAFGPISVRPDLLFPEAVSLGMGLVVVTAVEVRGFQPNGEVFDQQFLGMECVWAGNVASSMLEKRESVEREAKARVVSDWLRTQEPLLLHCEPDAPDIVKERVERDRIRYLEAIRMVEEALNSG